MATASQNKFCHTRRCQTGELWVRANKLGDTSVKTPALPKETVKINYQGQEWLVQGSGKGSSHREGQALDIGPRLPKEFGPIDEMLAKFGLRRPFLPADEPHVTLMADGGIAGAAAGSVPSGPGPVIPLKTTNVPVDIGTAGELISQLKPLENAADPAVALRESVAVDLKSAVRRLAEELNKPKESQIEMLTLLRDISKTNAETADISGKIARAAMN